MNNNGLKSLVYTAITIGIIILCVTLFIRILPYLLIGGIVLWATIKIIGAIKGNKDENRTNYSSTTYSNVDTERVEEILEDSGEVIDVDYKDVK